MSLRYKIIAILSAIVLLNVVADNVSQRFMVSRRFEELERSEAQKDLERAVEGVQEEIDVLRGAGRRWAWWDDTYRFVQDGNESYRSSNLGPGALGSAGLHLLYICDEQGRVRWGRIEASETRDDISLRNFPREQLHLDHALILQRDTEEDGGFGGLMLTEGGPLLVASHSIRTSQGEGEPRGTLILGRFLDEELLAAIGDRLQVDLELWAFDAPDMPARERELVDQVTSSDAPVHDAVDGDWLHVYTTLPDMRRAPKLLLRGRVERDISKRGLESVRYALLSTLGTALLILFVLFRLLQRIVLRPLEKLTTHAESVGQTDDTSKKVGMEDRADEFGVLSREFDGMLAKLADSRAAHAETARLVGMSEIATGVLHNVGNVLNSVNVSANLVHKRTDGLKVGDLQKMTAILTEHADDLGTFVTEDPRGKHLLPFLTELGGALVTQKGAIVEELQTLSQGIEHIIELVRAQQSYAGKGGLFERSSIQDQVDAAVSITQQALMGREDVEIVREYEDVEPFPLDRRKVTEILVNLIQNARQAMRDSGGKERKLILRIKNSGPDMRRIEVRDNGSGITPEDMAKIFNHGFTTKDDGHGFGLHSAANAATEMKGKLWAESDGPGAGATFILELPTHPEEVRTAA